MRNFLPHRTWFVLGFMITECKHACRGYCVRTDTVSSVCPRLCSKCLTLCFWQFAPIVPHFLIGGTLVDWVQSTAKECDIPF